MEFVETLGRWTIGTGPLYRRLASAIESAIRAGWLGPDQVLPSERMLANLLGVSRTTIDTAYEELASLGFIATKRGSGTRVAALPSDARVGGRLVASTTYSSSRSRNGDVVDFTVGALISMPSGVAETMASTLALSLQADPPYGPLGIQDLRESIARRYTADGIATSADQILVTTGAQQAISLIAALFIEPGDRVAVEDSTYFGALDAFRAAGARVTAFDTANLGAVSGARFFSVMASVHNPTGTTMLRAQRSALLDAARASGAPIIDDAALADLQLDGRVHAPLAATHDDPMVITLGSLSKVAWAALRIGWVRAARATIDRLARLKAVADLGTSPVAQRLALPLIERLDELRIARRRETIARVGKLAGLLRLQLPAWQFDDPSGGFALWVRLADGDGEAFAQLALDEGALVTPGSRMAVDGRHRDRIRLTALGDPERFAQGVAALKRAAERSSQGSASPSE
ncbi:MAG TPA: PLP-dependent aminotransferase family protein [Candidatus Baltobacteraceae bacterium]